MSLVSLSTMFVLQDLLTATASKLWAWTEGLVTVDHVNVIVPSTWDITNCLGQYTT